MSGDRNVVRGRGRCQEGGNVMRDKGNHQGGWEIVRVKGHCRGMGMSSEGAGTLLAGGLGYSSGGRGGC